MIDSLFTREFLRMERERKKERKGEHNGNKQLRSNLLVQTAQVPIATLAVHIRNKGKKRPRKQPWLFMIDGIR